MLVPLQNCDILKFEKEKNRYFFYKYYMEISKGFQTLLWVYPQKQMRF